MNLVSSMRWLIKMISIIASKLSLQLNCLMMCGHFGNELFILHWFIDFESAVSIRHLSSRTVLLLNFKFQSYRKKLLCVFFLQKNSPFYSWTITRNEYDWHCWNNFKPQKDSLSLSNSIRVCSDSCLKHFVSNNLLDMLTTQCSQHANCL